MTKSTSYFAIDRRALLKSGLVCSLGLSACATSGAGDLPNQPGALRDSTAAMLDQRFAALIDRHRVPGLAAAIIVDGHLAWARGYGLADIENGRPMTADTIQNVGSVTKTVTTTLALQDVEAHRLDLDSDINGYLRFSIRNPKHPTVPITLRQLLTHRSSIRDGIAYLESYRCGDQVTSLEDWLQTYFGASMTSDHFHDWAPGTLNPPSNPLAYSNVAFGLVGLLSERVGGQPYDKLCRERIFGPLGMTSTAFRLDTLDRAREAAPYLTLANDFKSDDLSEAERALARYPEAVPKAGGHHAYCSYSFATPPDGLMRTSVRDLAQFMMAWIGNGSRALPGSEAARVLSAETVAMALAPVHYERPLGWHEVRKHFGSEDPIPGSPLIGHNGSDPGIGSVALLRPADRSGFVMIFNASYDNAIANDGLELYLETLASRA